MTKINHYFRKNFARYATIGLGSMLMAISINIFLLPHHMLSGGISGVAMILHFLFNSPIGTIVALLNIPVFYCAYRFLDRESVFIGLYGMMVFAGGIDLTSFLSAYTVTDDILLAAIFGGVLTGVGAGLVFRVNGNTGGADIIAVIVKKYYALDIGSVMFAINILLMTISALLFGFKPAMYTLLSMYVGSTMVDRVIEGFNRKKTVMVISDHCEEIAGEILAEIGRGVTFLQGEGAFTHQERKLILVVVTLIQIAKIKSIIQTTDPKAFIIIQDAAEVSGRGFTLPSSKPK
jgi:uncharacterized membrane-anchored protein YitT (DUF2179 family)